MLERSSPLELCWVSWGLWVGAVVAVTVGSATGADTGVGTRVAIGLGMGTAVWDSDGVLKSVVDTEVGGGNVASFRNVA